MNAVLNVRFSTFAGELIRQAEPLHITPRGQLWVRMLDNDQRKLIDTSSLVMPQEMRAMEAPDFEPRTVPAVYASELPSCRGNCNNGRAACWHPAVCAMHADTSTDDDPDDLPGPVTQTLSLDAIKGDCQRSTQRKRWRLVVLVAVVCWWAVLAHACKGVL